MLHVFTDKAAVRAFSRQAKADGKRVALVPTMGALHAGHLYLVELAAKYADIVIVSIYVNPTQFDRADDLAKYPRTLEADLTALSATPAAAVFAPSNMYEPGNHSWVEVDTLGDHLCGATRPGHFRGVTTIVSKLFHVVEPDVAVFGNKDYQQRRIISQMVRDLDFGIDIIGAPIQRESDGLALSSRNSRLSEEARQAALAIPKALFALEASFKGGEAHVGTLLSALTQALTEAGGTIDYAELVDEATLVPHSHDTHLTAPSLVAVAVFFGGVRLIDNLVLEP